MLAGAEKLAFTTALAGIAVLGSQVTFSEGGVKLCLQRCNQENAASNASKALLKPGTNGCICASIGGLSQDWHVGHGAASPLACFICIHTVFSMSQDSAIKAASACSLLAKHFPAAHFCSLLHAVHM